MLSFNKTDFADNVKVLNMRYTPNNSINENETVYNLEIHGYKFELYIGGETYSNDNERITWFTFQSSKPGFSVSIIKKYNIDGEGLSLKNTKIIHSDFSFVEGIPRDMYFKVNDELSLTLSVNSFGIYLNVINSYGDRVGISHKDDIRLF